MLSAKSLGDLYTK